MIRPIIEYGDIVYDNLTIMQADYLEKIQRRAALICTGAYRHQEHKLLLKDLGWEYLSDRRRIHRLCNFYKFTNGQAPSHITPLMPTTVSSVTNYNLRNKTDLRPPQARLTSYSSSFFPKTTREWNRLPAETKASLSFYSFKKIVQPKQFKNLYFKTHIGKHGAWLSRIRMGLSALNFQRFTYGLLEDPTCPKCNNGRESAIHYFWDCTSYVAARDIMVGRINGETEIQANRDNILSIVLQGKIDIKYHKIIYNIATEYMASTLRFK